MTTLAIDAVDEEPAVALCGDGEVIARDVWTTAQNHSVELLPRIDGLLRQQGVDKGDLRAVFVDIGPGGYAALRVGVSIAKTIAHALAIPLLGVGRLELDAWRASGAGDARRIVAVHRAGRGDLAWAAYRRDGDEWCEEQAPRMTQADALLTALDAGVAVTGDIDDALAERFASTVAIVAPRIARIDALVALGQRRLDAGRADDPRTLVPLYLRAPAIGPQTPL
jgi:tRNA threonylcarbamoyladenosine biosynthesis protein TsaB